MKALLLLLFLAGGSAALADESLLKNGDFSSGISHWEGDCHTVGSASDDSGATSGVVIKLRSGDWTKISQDFDAKPGNYLLTITYTASSGLTFSQRPEDYTNLPGKMGLNGLGFLRRMPAPGQWEVIVNDTGDNFYMDWKITPKINASGVQTVKLNVQLDSTASFKKGFFLGLPPGDGFINIQSISLASENPAPSSP